MADVQGRRSTHMSASTSGATTSILRKGANAEFEFNLGSAKNKVLKSLEEKLPSLFKKFYNSQLYDKILQACLLFLITKFQYDWVTKAMDKARKTHLEGYNPYAVAAKLNELEEDSTTRRMELSPLYSEVILKFSTYQKPQQDKIFFESMYETLTQVLEEAFAKLTLSVSIEEELGLLFRSRHFNLAKRQNQPARSIDTLSVAELYSLKHETSNRALNAKMLTSLYEKPESLGVTVASVTNSPLIKQYITSPIVARSMMKDPQEREAMFEKVKRDAASPRRNIKAVFKTAARLQGVDVSNLRANLPEMKTSEETNQLMGIVPAEKAYRADRRGRVEVPGPLVAETIGLPIDEQYNYLVMLRRYVLFGPTLGIAPTATGTLGGVGSGMDVGSGYRQSGNGDGGGD